MMQHDYFAHTSQGNPPTTPFDRMAEAGYPVSAASENIAKAGSPQAAHDEWLHSSGHHRNIVSNWEDMGSGWGKGPWTQNFGSGGGGPTAAPGKEAVPATTDSTESEGGGG